MITDYFTAQLCGTLNALKHDGLYKIERAIESPQSSSVLVSGNSTPLVNFCSNNYLGLANHSELIEVAAEAVQRYGYGMASVRFICGTQTVHTELESAISGYLGVEDTILFPSCFDANAGIFEVLLDSCDAIVSDRLNHASIIDGVRLCKAQRFFYANNHMEELERALRAANRAGARHVLIVTDGVFSMDGTIANLSEICELAEFHGAMVMVDDSHATGVLGEQGRGTPAHCKVEGRVDIVTSTLGKALGGGAGGFIAARADLVALLRQRARPYLFSNTMLPLAAAVAKRAIELVADGEHLRKQLRVNAARLRSGLALQGYELVPGEHPIVPVIVGDATLSQRIAEHLFESGVYATSFSYPVVPKGKARIRLQVSAIHTEAEIDHALVAFADARQLMGLERDTADSIG